MSLLEFTVALFMPFEPDAIVAVLALFCGTHNASKQVNNRATAKEIDKIIPQLTNILRYADIRKEIYQFTLQVMHHPLKVTGMGLFYLGNECLQKFSVTVLTFVIIMAQMEIRVGPKILNTVFSKIHYFTLQTMHHPLKFNGMRLFYFGHEFLRQIFRKCLKKLSFVDNTLELLGTPKEYHKIRNSINWIFITWFVIICMTWFLDSLWLIEKYNDIRAMFIPMIKNYPLYINIFMDLMYVFLLSFIGTRLDKINGHIKELSEIEEYEIRCTWKKSLIVIRPYMRGAGNRKHVLWIAIQIYNGNTTQLKLIFSWNIWFTVCLIKIMLFNHTCENISTKAKKTEDLIHKLTNCICFAETREEILQFVLQISLRPLKFSGLGLFYFGYKFICKFFIRILTTVIFLLQIDTPSVSQILIPDRSNTTC
ncbi:uncharacterized protein LOC120358467 [Solenopsis invicta]|uniref:uncharacterized protein LOC120358467 n=1 Tax=Solenopsis invicta TaxID=13686 RepID=UPI00193DDF64|nr:uncharacterized protein LOC120358467 [Solenopsis invicta]